MSETDNVESLASDQLNELAYYYPEPYWLAQDSSWIKSLLLFFDGVAILLPDYMSGRELVIAAIRAGMEPVLAAGQTREIQAGIATAKSVIERWERSHEQVTPLTEADVRIVLAQAGITEFVGIFGGPG